MSSGPQPASQAKLNLVRTVAGPDGAFGMLLLGTAPLALTLERTYEVVTEGQPRQIVKIPAGVYRCERTWFARGHHETFEVTGVVGHSRLLLHRGNTETDSEGCILLGTEIGVLNGKPALLSSASAFQRFMTTLEGVDAFTLEIRA